MSHLAFRISTPHDVDLLWQDALDHGWQQLYKGRHVHAGGRGHYAATLEDADRCKAELIASPLLVASPL